MHSLHSVEAYVAGKPEWIQMLLNRLRRLIVATVPTAVESIKYTVPFYTYHGLFCFLSAKPDRVVLALCEGASLEDPFEIMSGDQKQIRHIVISKTGSFPEREIIYMLLAAARYNETRQLANQAKTKKRTSR